MDELIGDYLGEEASNAYTKNNNGKITTPIRNVSKAKHLKTTPGPVNISECTFSPCTNKSEIYNERTQRNHVVANFGCIKPFAKVSNKTNILSSTVEYFNTDCALMDAYKYMYQLPYDITIALSNYLDEMVKFVKIEENSEEAVVGSSDINNSEEQGLVFGLIISNDSGKLDSNSIALQMSRKLFNGKTIKLDISSLQSYSFFPGQFCAFRGLSLYGEKFMAENILNISLPQQPDVTFMSNLDSFSVFIAAGPFTTSDNLDYQPLLDLIKLVVEMEPDVLILTGPFVPIKHELITKNMLVYSCEKMFDIILDNYILQPLAKTQTQVLIVSSSREAFHDNVYPNPPYRPSKTLASTDKIKFISDPSLIRINGVVFGVTSTDVLFDMCKEEISDSSTDRMSKLLEHIFLQRNFYPLYPPNEKLCIDYTQFYDHAGLPIRPHVLITPSTLRYFIKDVTDVCCLNPGNLSKGQGGGTFCRMQIQLQNLPSVNCKFSNCISAEIVKI